MDTIKAIIKFLAKGELIMWGYSISMIVLSWYSVVYQKVIDGSVAAMYLGALGSYVGKKGFDEWREMRAPKTKPEEVKQGD